MGDGVADAMVLTSELARVSSEESKGSMYVGKLSHGFMSVLIAKAGLVGDARATMMNVIVKTEKGGHVSMGLGGSGRGLEPKRILIKEARPGGKDSA